MPLWDPATCPHTVTILAPSSGQDAGGGNTTTYATRTAGVKGIMSSASASEVEMFAQQNIQVSAALSCTDVTAQRGDVLLYNGKYLRVVGVNVNDAIGNIPQLCRLTLSELL